MAIPLREPLDQLRRELERSNRLSSNPPAPPPPRPQPSPSSMSRPSACPCRGQGSLLADLGSATAQRLVIVERYADSALVICPQCAAGRERMAAWRGLPPEAEGVRLQNLRAFPSQQVGLRAVAHFLQQPEGWLTFAGGYGAGKTTLIYAALNHLADAGIYGHYTTAPDLVDHLRDALRDADGRAHSARLERLKTVPVLAVDELDKYRGTEYAEEAIFKLFDHRYRERQTLATLIGYNRERGDRIPPFLRSRIRDGRFQLIDLDGADLRPAITDEPAQVWATVPSP